MSQDQAIADARQLWEDKKPKEALIVLIKRVNELSPFPDERSVSQAKELWNQKKPREALILLINRINELNSQFATAFAEQILEEDVASKQYSQDRPPSIEVTVSPSQVAALTNDQNRAPTANPSRARSDKSAWLWLIIPVFLGFGLIIGWSLLRNQKQDLPSEAMGQVNLYFGDESPEILSFQKAIHPENFAHIELPFYPEGIHGVEEAWCLVVKLDEIHCGYAGGLSSLDTGYVGAHVIAYRQGAGTWDSYTWAGPWLKAEKDWRSIGCDWKETFKEVSCK